MFDSDMRQLQRDAGAVDLPPKALLLLETLLEQRPRPVSKQALQDRLWPDTFVSESSLARLVAELRQAVGDDAREPRLIRTVHRFGYAFAGEARGLDAAPAAATTSRCWLVWRDREYPLARGENHLGRGEDSVVPLPLGQGVAPPRPHPRGGERRPDRGPRQQERHLRRRRAHHRPHAAGRR